MTPGFIRRPVPGEREVVPRTKRRRQNLALAPEPAVAVPAFRWREFDMNAKRLVTDGLCAALYVVLSTFLSLSLGPIKLSVDGLPVLLAALLFGPVDGVVVGLLSGFLGQLLGPYGISATTPLWMLPVGVLGLIVGLYAKGHGPDISRGRLAVLVLIALVADTTVTTAVMYVDCLVYKYSFITYSPYIVWRYVADGIKTVIYTLVLPPLTGAIRKGTGNT